MMFMKAKKKYTLKGIQFNKDATAYKIRNAKKNRKPNTHIKGSNSYNGSKNKNNEELKIFSTCFK